jgi:1-acyl-sn-glycerol-3-phosphate acyltransferase
MARIAGVRLRVVGLPVRVPALLVSNHRSWLDIPVLAAATGAAFVAKDELRNNPIVRWLCDQNATLFVNRGDRRAVGAQAEAVRAALARGQPLVLFAEGTVSLEPALLPFRPSLLSAVAPAPEGVAVRPVAVAYGTAHADLAWPAGESGVANFRKVMGRRGRLDATVHLLQALPASTDRKALAREAHFAISEALGLSAKLSDGAVLPYDAGQS